MTARSELAFSEVEHPGDESGIREWAVRGPDGAVNFLARGPVGLVIGFHRPVQYGANSLVSHCDLLDGGWCGQDITYLGAQELETRWQAAGGDEAVIRADLETWYASHLAPGGELT
jgi:hypothetical protein